MKEYIQTIKAWISKMRSYPTFEAMPSKYLLMIFVFPACYMRPHISELWERYKAILHALGLTWQVLNITFMMVIIAFSCFLCACVARRTGGLLYQRWFK